VNEKKKRKRKRKRKKTAEVKGPPRLRELSALFSRRRREKAIERGERR